MKNIKLSGNFSSGQGPVINLRCPICGHNGTFERIGDTDLCDINIAIWFGQRKCPNSNCRGHIFYIQKQDKTLYTYPPEIINFNKDGIPDNVLFAFDEAVKCHSNSCFIASAIMIRKTLEEICVDRGSKGDNLKKRLQDLGAKILIPKELIEGMDELRLLGNDAAHIESHTFEEIGKEEIEISIEFTKEILKGVYQYEGLLSKLRGLKKS
ncbi:MAG: DUF4145 domain-containing protein [Bacteroidota bacterium]|nr:DUF4145 domain-containing protein [Bacteroidota bacterium]